MKIQETKRGAVLVVKPDGPLTGEDAATFAQRMEAGIQQSLGRVVVDMATVPFVDSRGLEVMVDLHQQLDDAGQVLKLCHVNPTVREVLDLTGLGALFEQFDEVNAGVRSFL